MPEVRYATIQFPGVRYPLGDVTLTALVPRLDGTIALQDRGKGMPTFTRSSTALVRQWDDSYVECASNEPRFEGARRVSEGVWSWQKSDGTPLHPIRHLKWTNPDTDIRGTVATVFAYYGQRANSTAYALGDRVWATATDGFRYWYECTVAGTSAGSDPGMPTSGTVVDGTVTWTFGGLYRFRGLLLEPAATNLFLNSDAPATQTISITTTGDYTVSVIGSGSATSSDNTATSTGHGAASDGSPVTFNVSATGTVDITISGTPTYVQVETGQFATSPIVTAGSAVTRATEVDAAQWQRTGNFSQATGTLLASVEVAFDAPPPGNVGIIGVRSTRIGLLYGSSGVNNVLSFDGASSAFIAWGGLTPMANCAVNWSGTSFSLHGARPSEALVTNTQAYDGAWTTSEDAIRLGPASLDAGPLRVSNLLVFQRDMGTTWIDEVI